MECGVGLWGFKDPFSLELHCAKCNNVVLCNVLVINKSLAMVFDLLFIIWVFYLMWLVGICDGLWVWTNCYCKWAKFFPFWNWGSTPIEVLLQLEHLFFFRFIVMLQVPKAWWSMYFKSFDISMVHRLPNFRHFECVWSTKYLI
jgi:hypothetical protein